MSDPATPVPPRESRTPNTQGAPRRWRPRLAFLQELPPLRFHPREPDEHAPLIAPDELEALLKGCDPVAAQQVRDDIAFMEYELLRLFRQRDHAAKYHQNRYRKLQIYYLILATLAALFGSLQALFLAGNPAILPVFAFIETIIALLAAFLATTSGREAPLPLWLTNRRRAEELRREYFRFLLRLGPFDTAEGHRLYMLLSRRAADMSRGDFPDRDE